MHEIVTIQLGQQANFVGTHYWNTQESYFTYSNDEESPVNHDISFRPGIGADGSETYTPRTLIYDLKGAFGSLRRENALYQLEQQSSSDTSIGWHGPTVPLRLPQIEPSSYQQALDQGTELPALTTETVRFWSDYNHVFYHPRSIVQLNEYELNSSLMPFEQWSNGEELFTNLDREHDILDRDLRPFLEECDQLQAIQVFTNTDDAWGGFSAKYMECIADDLGKGCRWVFGLQDSKRVSPQRQRLRLANTAHSVYSLSSSTSMHIPIVDVPAQQPSYLSLNTSSPWHTAAMQAVALETATLPTRLRRSQPGHAAFDDLETNLGGDGKRPIASCMFRVSEPDGTTSVNGHQDSKLPNGHHEEDAPANEPTSVLDVNLFPDIPTGQATVRLRDSPRIRIFSEFKCQRGSAPGDSVEDDAEQQGRRTEGPRVSALYSPLLFPILSSYPRIFRFDGRPQKLAIDTSLSTSSLISQRVRTLEQATRRSIGIDEREALCDGLATIAEEYEEGWMSDEDSEDE